MIPAIVVLLQVVIPVVVIARLFQARRLSLLAWMLFFAGAVSFIAAITVAGVWLALPWYTGLAYLLIVAAAVMWRSRDVRGLRWRPRGRFGWAELGICAVFATGTGILFVHSIASRQAPAAASINLAFPLNGATYYVANGGGQPLTNAHVETLAAGKRDYRGQSYAIDVVRIGDRGRTGEPVLSPCNGRVLQVENTAPDMTPPAPDPTRLAGNFVLLDCGAAQVFLGHLKQGSVAVERGQRVQALERIGSRPRASARCLAPGAAEHRHRCGRTVGASLRRRRPAWCGG
jgi:hypothetical protein